MTIIMLDESADRGNRGRSLRRFVSEKEKADRKTCRLWIA